MKPETQSCVRRLSAAENDMEEAEAVECEAKLAGLRVTGQRLLARIRPSSKYFEFQDVGFFPVAIAHCSQSPPYNVQGGPGGRYRLSDVFVFAMIGEGAEPVQITF